jgi:hypothetical protein
MPSDPLRREAFSRSDRDNCFTDVAALCVRASNVEPEPRLALGRQARWVHGGRDIQRLPSVSNLDRYGEGVKPYVGRPELRIEVVSIYTDPLRDFACLRDVLFRAYSVVLVRADESKNEIHSAEQRKLFGRRVGSAGPRGQRRDGIRRDTLSLGYLVEPHEGVRQTEMPGDGM